jgi:hypothetical protein
MGSLPVALLGFALHADDQSGSSLLLVPLVAILDFDSVLPSQSLPFDALPLLLVLLSLYIPNSLPLSFPMAIVARLFLLVFATRSLLFLLIAHIFLLFLVPIPH